MLPGRLLQKLRRSVAQIRRMHATAARRAWTWACVPTHDKVRLDLRSHGPALQTPLASSDESRGICSTAVQPQSCSGLVLRSQAENVRLRITERINLQSTRAHLLLFN